MQKKIGDLHESAFASAKKTLGEKCLCCVLISCTEATADGNMEVEMRFDGDESLAALLVENAGQIFEERSPHRKSK